MGSVTHQTYSILPLRGRSAWSAPSPAEFSVRILSILAQVGGDSILNITFETSHFPHGWERDS
jgi:hypothetical protein